MCVSVCVWAMSTFGEDTLTWTMMGASEVFISWAGWLMVSASSTTSCRERASSKIRSISLCTSATHKCGGWKQNHSCLNAINWEKNSNAELTHVVTQYQVWQSFEILITLVLDCVRLTESLELLSLLPVCTCLTKTGSGVRAFDDCSLAGVVQYRSLSQGNVRSHTSDGYPTKIKNLLVISQRIRLCGLYNYRILDHRLKTQKVSNSLIAYLTLVLHSPSIEPVLQEVKKSLLHHIGHLHNTKYM